jgi:hypothetical protein
MTPDERLIDRYVADPRVTIGTGFGASRGLRVNDRIFAIFMDDGLTLKLPAARVDALVAAGHATRFDGGKGRPMREWVTIRAARSGEWDALADEALAFVARR